MSNQGCKRWSTISINGNAVIQYFLIYIMIQYMGGRVATALGSDLFYGGTLALCFLLLLKMPNRLSLKKSVFEYLIILGCSMGLSFTMTGGDLSIGTIFSILSRFILVYVVIQYDVDNFLYRFIKMVFLMACISLIEFAFVQIVGTSNALGLFSHLYQIRNSASWLGSSYGLFFICYNFMDPKRNAYMFGEPGEYQMILITVLFFMTFFDVKLDRKAKIRYYLVFLITLITTQSTSGYFNLIALAVAVMLTNREQVHPFLRRIIVTLIAALILYLIFFYSENSFLYKNFFSKILSDSNKLDLAANTGIARVVPMKRFIETINSVPQKLIFGVGFSGLDGLPLGGYSTCGMINSIAMIGIISSVLLYGNMFKSLFQESKSLIQAFLGMFIVINMGLSQPDILSIASVLICMYGGYSGIIYRKKKEGK